MESPVVACGLLLDTHHIALSEACVHTRRTRRTTVCFFAATYTLHKLSNVLLASFFTPLLTLMKTFAHLDRIRHSRLFRYLDQPLALAARFHQKVFVAFVSFFVASAMPSVELPGTRLAECRTRYKLLQSFQGGSFLVADSVGRILPVPTTGDRSPRDFG